ncbi:hypothetical protein FOMPIDRAFT_1014962 [Fomitopsis schrenkii]|uniref:Uncharacterized protein n=1 Tax=Fomitopsis schrenkii TaxID=2126942 RepID=S8FXM2_FOMSC|nr:hypothetical protein FOMPIDRAFT_1014962 [Fomitopsis schrenkii]
MDTHSDEPDTAESTRSSTPPFTRLPNELLHIILLTWISEAWHECSMVYYEYQGVPLEAARVCSHWRSLVLSSPDLWTHIVLSPESHPRKLEAYISRSRHLPLYIKYFNIYFLRAGIYTDNVEGHGRLLAANTHRLRELHIDRLHAQHILPLLSPLYRRSAPLLDRLTVRSTSCGVSGIKGWPKPNLRNLVLGGVELTLPVNQLHGLEALVLKGNHLCMTVPRLLKSLKECRNLKFLHLDTLTVRTKLKKGALPQMPIHMGSLEYFGFGKGLRGGGSDDTEVVGLDFLNYISFPASASVAITLSDIEDFGTPLPSSSSVAAAASAQAELCLEIYSIADLTYAQQTNYARLRSPCDRFRVTWSWADAVHERRSAQDLHRMVFEALGLDSLRALTVALPYSVRGVFPPKPADPDGYDSDSSDEESDDEDDASAEDADKEEPDRVREALESTKSTWNPGQSMWFSILTQIPRSVTTLTMFYDTRRFRCIPDSYRGSGAYPLVRFHGEWFRLIAKYCQQRKEDGEPVEKVHLAVDDGVFPDGIKSIEAAKRILGQNVTDVSHSARGNQMSRKEPAGSFYQRCRDFGLFAPMIEETVFLHL